MSETGRQLCAYCRTELAADAEVCEACGMTQAVLTAPALQPPPEIPAPSALTGPALRPPPDPPAVTAPTLLPPPEPPAPTTSFAFDSAAMTVPGLRPPPDPPGLTAPSLRPPLEPPAGEPPRGAAGDPLAPGTPAGVPQAVPSAGRGGVPLAPGASDVPSAAGGGDPLVPGAPAGVPQAVPSAGRGGDPLAPAPSSRDPLAGPPALAGGDPLAAAPASGDPLAAALLTHSEPAEPVRAEPEPPTPPASAAPATPAHAAAHPSDETPAGYVTAASLWPVSTHRPGSSPTDDATDPDAAAREAAAAAARHAAQAPVPDTLPPMGAAKAPLAPVDDTAPPAPPRRPPEPAAINRSRIDKRTAGIVAAIVALATVATVAVLVLTGGSEPSKPLDAGSQEAPAGAVVQAKTPKPVTTTAASTTKKAPDLDAQVQQLDKLMLLSKKGRAEAVKGDIKAATASRATLLSDLKRLQAKAADKDLKAAVASFEAAIAEALRQNRECGSKCSAADLNKVGDLKQAALRKLNPLLKAHGAATYRVQEI